MSVQIMSTHTLYDMCDVLCYERIVGDDEDADSHMRNFVMSARNRYTNPTRLVQL
jgi:hypothetical protein